MRQVILAILIGMLAVPVCAQYDLSEPAQIPKPSGLFFSFASGSPLYSTKIGLRMGPLAPYGAFDIINLSFSVDDESTSYVTDQYNYRYKDYEYEDHIEASGTLIIPRAGAKLFLGQFPLNLYATGDVFYILPSVKMESKGKDVEYNPDGSIYYYDEWEYSLETDEEEMIEDAIDFMGITAGIGVEYAFNSHFSVGGEYGFRMIFDTFTDEGTDEDYYDYSDEWKLEVKSTLGITYTSFTLNYYF